MTVCPVAEKEETMRSEKIHSEDRKAGNATETADRTDNVRAVALSVLRKCMLGDQYSNLALDAAMKRNVLSASDRALLTALVYGVLERRLTLDAGIDAYSERPASETDADTRLLLQMGMYQLCYLDRVPDHAAVYETVALAPRRVKGFVNAVLRSFLRSGKQIPVPKREQDPIGYLSVTYSFAPSVCTMFVQTFGMERTERLLEAFCNKPPLTLRVNTLFHSREAFRKHLEEHGYTVRLTEQSKTGLLLPGGTMASLPDFSEGAFFVQDEASQLCVEALDVRPGMTLIDTCACPGSKSFGAAMQMQNKGRVIACDLHSSKLSLVRSGASRLGISIVETVSTDARQPHAEWLETADRVLCDVPCSGFGVCAKKPELRYKDPNMSAKLPEIQTAILNNASAYVKRGGRLVYSTCTILPRENEHVVRSFLRTHPEFCCVDMRTLYPDTDSTDGFFIAVLERDPKSKRIRVLQ